MAPQNEIEIGQKYAMRERLSAKEPLLQVQVVDKTGRKGQVKVRRLADPYKGLEEWVQSKHWSCCGRSARRF
jgi:hypothetical protein